MACVTIYTDASVDPAKKTGGWACWIKYAPGETSLHSGAFREDVACPTEAELMAIANGLVSAKRLLAGRRELYVVVTDSAGAIDYIEQAKRRASPHPSHSQRKLKDRHFFIAKTILSLLPPGSELRVNKVKAHFKGDGARSYLNDKVDKAARAAMRKAREA